MGSPRVLPFIPPRSSGNTSCPILEFFYVGLEHSNYLSAQHLARCGTASRGDMLRSDMPTCVKFITDLQALSLPPGPQTLDSFPKTGRSFNERHGDINNLQPHIPFLKRCRRSPLSRSTIIRQRANQLEPLTKRNPQTRPQGTFQTDQHVRLSTRRSQLWRLWRFHLSRRRRCVCLQSSRPRP